MRRSAPARGRCCTCANSQQTRSVRVALVWRNFAHANRPHRSAGVHEVNMRKQSLRVLLAGLALTGVPVASFSFVSVGVSINIAPPELPVYVQPPCPEV